MFQLKNQKSCLQENIKDQIKKLQIYLWKRKDSSAIIYLRVFKNWIVIRMSRRKYKELWRDKTKIEHKNSKQPLWKGTLKKKDVIRILAHLN